MRAVHSCNSWLPLLTRYNLSEEKFLLCIVLLLSSNGGIFKSIFYSEEVAGEETSQLVADFGEAWNLIRNSLEMYGRCCSSDVHDITTIDTSLEEMADILYVIICSGNLASTIFSNKM